MKHKSLYVVYAPSKNPQQRRALFDNLYAKFKIDVKKDELIISSDGKDISAENVFEKIKKNMISALLKIIISNPVSL